MEFEKKVCPDCNGSGVYQEYDEYDRYTVHSCATCDGSGEIARQSATSEEVNESLCKLCANVGCYDNERNLMMLECTEYISPKGEQWMRPEEAIDAIEKNMPTRGTYTKLTEALRLSIATLSKQIPMKPTARFYPDGSVESVCQNCKDVVEEGLFIYCPSCGQKLDWSEE